MTIQFDYRVALNSKFPMFGLAGGPAATEFSRSDRVNNADRLLKLHTQCMKWLTSNDDTHTWVSDNIIQFNSAEDLIMFRLVCGI